MADSDNPVLLRLHQALSSSSNDKLLHFLNSISDSVEENDDNDDDDLDNNAFQILSEIHRYVSASTLDQEVVDSLSFELPRPVARLGCASRRCLEMAESIVHCLTEKCNPRDMLSFLCGALGSPGERFKLPNYFAPLLSSFPKAFVSIRRRKFEQVKAAIPVILNVFKTVSLKLDDEETDPQDLYHTAIQIADSLRAICMKLEGTDKEKVCALLGLYVLEIMALISMGMRQRVSGALPLVIELSQFLQHCGLSYIGLIVGSDVDKLADLIMGDDNDAYLSCFSDIQHGASLSVIWGYKSNEVAAAAEADITAVRNELLCSQTKRWQAVGMLKHIFSCVNLPWELKQQAIDFLLGIMDGNMPLTSPDGDVDCSIYATSIYAALQAIQGVIMYASDVMLRKKAFAALKKVLADIPSSTRFDLLKALVTNSDCSSMIAVLLDCVRAEMQTEITKRTEGTNGVLEAGNGNFQDACFCSASVLELVELVLRPPKGGPPSLPEYSDAVLSALNLYRFVFITESTGKTNYTGVLSKESLRKAYHEWLLPLRTLVTGIEAENQKDYDELASEISCALNPVEFVLHRCIELVDEQLQRSS